MNKSRLKSIIFWIFLILSYNVVSATIAYYEPITEIRLVGELSIICGPKNYGSINFYIIDRNPYNRQIGHEFWHTITNNDESWKITIRSLCRITDRFIVKEIHLSLEQKEHPYTKIKFSPKYMIQKSYSSSINCDNLDTKKFKFYIENDNGCGVVIKFRFIQFDVDFANTHNNTEIDCKKFFPSTLFNIEDTTAVADFSTNCGEEMSTKKPPSFDGDEKQTKSSSIYGGNVLFVLVGMLFAVCYISYLFVMLTTKNKSSRNRYSKLPMFLTTNDDEKH